MTNKILKDFLRIHDYVVPTVLEKIDNPEIYDLQSWDAGTGLLLI